MKTADIKFIELCDEIDYWKERALSAEIDVNYWKSEYDRHLKESLLNAQKGVANALMLALHTRDDKDGNLVITKESRKSLAKCLNK